MCVGWFGFRTHTETLSYYKIKYFIHKIAGEAATLQRDHEEKAGCEVISQRVSGERKLVKHSRGEWKVKTPEWGEERESRRTQSWVRVNTNTFTACKCKIRLVDLTAESPPLRVGWV